MLHRWHRMRHRGGIVSGYESPSQFGREYRRLFGGASSLEIAACRETGVEGVARRRRAAVDWLSARWILRMGHPRVDGNPVYILSSCRPSGGEDCSK